MKLGLLQLNPTVGDFDANVSAIQSAARQCVARGAELCIAPELAVSGYPPHDLLLYPDFVRRNLEARDRLVALSAELKCGLLFGLATPTVNDWGKPLHNSAVLCDKGEIIEGVETAWPAIVTRDTWESVCAYLSNPDRHTGKKRARDEAKSRKPLIPRKWLHWSAGGLLALGLLAAVTILYRVSLPEPLPTHRLVWGALLATAVFVVATAGLRVYLQYITRTGYTYGALATPIAFLLFAFFMGFAIMIGAELNAAIEEEWPAPKPHWRQWRDRWRARSRPIDVPAPAERDTEKPVAVSPS